MKQSATQPRYLGIAVDLAKRITQGEYRIGQQLAGHSLLASQYGVSPETIRRSIGLLSEMSVVEVKPQSGTIVLSLENAKQYVSYFEKNEEMRGTYNQIRKIAQEYRRLSEEMIETIDTFFEHRITLSALNQPFPNYEIPIPSDSYLIGKTIGDTKFWGRTGCTIVGIIRGERTVISPGPYQQFKSGDSFIVIGTPEAVETAVRLVQQRNVEE